MRGMKPKVLILGFSVTADKGGFAELVRRRAADHGIEVVVCGAGGVYPLSLPLVFEHVCRQRGPFDYVFLEIATSLYGAKVTDWKHDGLDLLYQIFSSIQATGAELAFINLYRDNFDYRYHVFDMLLESLAHRFNVPLLDLSAGLLAQRGVEFCRSLLRDVVHTTVEGGEFQAEAVWNFLCATLRRDTRCLPFPCPIRRREAVSFIDGCGGMESGAFSRSGLELRYGILKAGEECTIMVPPHARVSGISFLSGPLSGKLELTFRGANKIEVIQAFDEHCFYERYNYRLLNLEGCESVTCRQLEELPGVALRKGEMDRGQRVGKLVALHYVVDRSESEDG